MTPPGIDPGSVRLVPQRLNHYATTGPLYVYIYICVCIYIYMYVCAYIRTRVCICYVNPIFLPAISPHNLSSRCHSQQHQLHLPLSVQSLWLAEDVTVCLSVCLSLTVMRLRCSEEKYSLAIGFQIRDSCMNVGTSSCVFVCVCVCVCVRVCARACVPSAIFCCWSLKGPKQIVDQICIGRFI